MSADIEKLAVFDSRIVQSRPKQAVEKGALSVTNAPFNAIAATASQHTYNIYVPSENVQVDRALEWTSTVSLQFTATIGALGRVATFPVVQPGRDFSLCAFPLNSLCSTLTATINDTTAVINTQDVLQQVLRLADYKKARLQRTCPTMLDKYLSYNDAAGANNNPVGGYEDATAQDEVPNGAFYNLIFTDPAGNPLGTATPAQAGAPYNSLNGVPIAPAGGLAAGATVPIYVQFTSTEKLVLSPFVFADTHEWDTGLFGINNIQLIMNLLSSPSRLIRSTSTQGTGVSAVSYNTTAGAFQNSVVNVQFLTPSLDIPLPPKSVVPQMEFPRYISQPVTVGAGAVGQIQSQTITLPQIPDLLVIYAKPATGYADNTVGDFMFPLATRADSVRSPLSINFDNFSGLLSSHTAEELYAMSIHNGLEMDWNAWVGRAHSSAGAAIPNTVPLVGGPLVLKPGVDFGLQSGQAASLVGNFTLQINIQLKNQTSASQDVQLYIITVNSGFFESIRGSSRIIKGVLSEQDIITAPLAGTATKEQLHRVVGGQGFLSSLGNILSKAKDVYHATKPAVSAVKGMLPEGAVKSALGAVGQGEHGMGVGRGKSGGAKMLSQRLM